MYRPMFFSLNSRSTLVLISSKSRTFLFDFLFTKLSRGISMNENELTKITFFFDRIPSHKTFCLRWARQLHECLDVVTPSLLHIVVTLDKDMSWTCPMVLYQTETFMVLLGNSSQYIYKNQIWVGDSPLLISWFSGA